MSHGMIVQRVTGQERPGPVRSVRVVRVGLAGCGTVGGALLHLIEREADTILRVHGVRFDVVRVLVRDAARPRGVRLADVAITADAAEFARAECDLVVEALGGTGTAAFVARAALGAGRSLVTANKALLAAHGAELAHIAGCTGATLSFEAAVAGGVPIVRVLRDALHHTGVSAIRGVLNGTTNYILTRLAEGASFADALAEAQANGFAEADPTRDLDGRDAADKIAVLAWQAFGSAPGSLHVETRGLLPDPDRIVATAAAIGGVARLVAECLRLPAGIVAVVEPVIVAPGSALGGATSETNVVEVDTAVAGTLRFSGPGAGGAATAAAVLGDMVAAASTLPAAATRANGAAPAADPRPHRWVVAVDHGGRAALVAAAHRLRVRLEGIDAGTRGVHAVTGPVDRAAAGALARLLELERRRPLLLRCEA